MLDPDQVMYKNSNKFACEVSGKYPFYDVEIILKYF